jgi:UDP-glucose 4-epimerase
MLRFILLKKEILKSNLQLDLSMARYLVTGGAGFIGTNLCEALRAQGHEVIAIDNLSVSDVNVDHLKEIGVQFVQADIADYDAIEPYFAGVSTVFHLAAMNRAQRSIENPVAAHHANITGTLHVLEAMRAHNVPKKVFASSSSVYAGRTGLLAEDDKLAPPHPYGVGKLAGEHYVRVYSELFGIRYVTLRFFSVYGPRQLGTIDKAGVVAKFVHQARTNQPLTIYGDGNQLRNFTYVADVVRCCMLAAESTVAEGHIINVANPHEVSVRELAEHVKAVTNTPADISYLPPIAGDPPRNPAEITKSKQLLKYAPTVSFAEGIKHTVKWYDKTT